MARSPKTLTAPITGIVSALVTLAVAEVLALLVAPQSSPVFAVGSFVIDIVPRQVAQTVIHLFGSNDKLVLLICLGLLVLVLAVLIGVLHRRQRWLGVAALGLVGAVALAAVLTRAAATPLWAVPTVVGVAAGAVTLVLLGARGRATLEGDLSRRGFLIMAGAIGVAAVAAGAAARVANTALAAVNTVRESIVLPRAARGALPVPSGAELGIPGLTPLVTANADFYRVDTALQVPTVDASQWRLRITGMVENELELSYADLLALDLEEQWVTLSCVSNPVGSNLTDTALWLGYPLQRLLERAVPTAGADMVLSMSVDGYTASTPLAALRDENRIAMLAVGMNGEPLPLEHGFPARMIVAGLFGYVSATKWVTELRVSRFADEQAYWTTQGWDERAPVKMSSRVDVPAYLENFPAGTHTLAGVAWAQHVGVAGVEIRIDKGEWVPMTLAPAISDDTWVQWSGEASFATGVHLIQVRATDKNGLVQSGTRVSSFPNGAEGWYAITVESL